jgi:hypothetical protein
MMEWWGWGEKMKGRRIEGKKRGIGQVEKI